MRFLVFFIVMSFFLGCNQSKLPITGHTEFQVNLNNEFKDASKSPLKAKDLKDFKGLEFFSYDSTYVVTARLKRLPDSDWFNMRTTTDRLTKERVFGIIEFTIQGQQFKLNVYQGEELMQTEGFEDYLFLPFLDNTNGVSSYAGGRYIDLRIPNGDSITIDFNSAYNPLCAYNEKYSCPIVPRVNYLDMDIKAGVKAFDKQ